jgi:GH35 family endo-1,4-beta-xylanase
MRTIASLVLVFGLIVPAVHAATLNGNALAIRSTGSASSGSAWTLDRDGYLGTYITLATPGNVTVSVKAEGTASGGVNPNMNIVIADTKAGFNVKPGGGTYSNTYALPAGTFFVRTELNNDLALTSRQLKVDSFSVTGATISNTNSNSNALAASDTYIANYRKGNVTVDLSQLGVAAGTQVGVSLKRIAFNFGNAVPGSAPSEVDSYIGSAGTAKQIAYQAHLNQNFNAVVPENAAKWANDEDQRNLVTMGGTDQILNYAQAHGMYARMHNVIWDLSDGQPPWVNTLRTNATTGRSTSAKAAAKTDLTNAINSRINYYIPGRANKFGEIDVYNESYQGQYVNGKQSYWSIYGTDGIAGIYNNVKKSLAASGSNAKLYVNEYDALGAYAKGFFQNIETLRQAGIKDGYGEIIGGIGTEDYPSSYASHSPATIIAALQNYAVTGLPQTLTEFGVFSGVSANNSATILGDTLRLEFGNPSGTGFFMWGFQAEDGGGNLFAPSTALYTVNSSNWNNWTITPSGKKWQDLLGIQDWDGNANNGWTTQLTTSTAADGTINFNGYYGDYQLTVGGKAYALSIAKGTSRYTLTPVLGAAAGVPEPSSIGLILIGGILGAMCLVNKRYWTGSAPSHVLS